MSRFDEMSPLRRGALLIAVTLGVVVVIALVAEGAVRLRALLKYGQVRAIEDAFIYDETIDLRVPRPGYKSGPIAINSLGFRGPDIPAQKPAGTVRLAFLGGSTTYCAENSSNEAVWAHLVTQRLQAEYPDVNFDYVNGGVPGYTTSASLRNFVNRIAQLDPDIVVIYHATNDLSKFGFELAKQQGIVEERPDQGRFWLSDYSLLVHLAELNLKILLRQGAAAATTGKLPIDNNALSLPFRESLEALVTAVTERAPVVALATFATQYRSDQDRETQLAAASTSLYYMPYMSLDGLLQGFAAYNSVIRDVAQLRQVLLLEAAQEIPGDAVHFHDSVHFTDAGSRRMAELVAEGLLESGVVAQRVAAALGTETPYTR
jgi:lysophospholipase L1-like esterase